MENVSTEFLDKDEWFPPDPPLTVTDIQKGIFPTYKVKNELATSPITAELKHWSALPALSYFALNSVSLRESMRRIKPPTTFHPPPRLTLSENRKESWFADLKNPAIPLRQLSRAIPHCYTANSLLETLSEKDIPPMRAIWYIKCIGSNQVRALKRKAIASNPGAGQEQMAKIYYNIEQNWLKEWTQDFIAFISRTIDSYDQTEGTNVNDEKKEATDEGLHHLDTINENDFEISQQSTIESKSTMKVNETEQWKQRMKFATRIMMHLYDAQLINQSEFLEWILNELRVTSIQRLPCIVHLAELLWKPLTSPTFSHKFFKSMTHRYTFAHNGQQDTVEDDGSAQIGIIIEPILLKLATTNEDVLVAPRTWQVIEPLIRNHPAYSRLAERNQSFLVANPHGPSGWQLHIDAGTILDNFVRPYRMNDLVNSLLSLKLNTEIIVNVVLTWTVRQSTNASIQLCCAILKSIAKGDSSISTDKCCVDFLFDPHLIHGSECLGSLVSELLSSHLFHLGTYIQKVISSGVLYTSGPTRDLHVRVLKSLPFDRLTSGIRAQVEMILHKVDVYLPNVNLEPFIESTYNLFSEKSWDVSLSTQELCINDCIRLSEKLLNLYENVLAKLPSTPNLNLTPAIFVKFLDILEGVSCASVKPIFKALCMTLNSELCGSSLVSCVLRQVHVRLMAFVCAGLIDPFASKLIAKLQVTVYDFSGATELLQVENISLSSNQNDHHAIAKFHLNSDAENLKGNDDMNNIFQWVSWDDISALRAVIVTPSIMVELNRLVPLRQNRDAFKNTWGNTPNDQDMIKQLLYRPGSPDVSAILSLNGVESLSAPIIEYSQKPGADRTSVLQLVTYGAVTIEDVANDHNPNKFGMLRFLLLEPANELGFSLEEVDQLRQIRRSYLEHTKIESLCALSSSTTVMKFLSRIAHLYPDIFINRMLPESKVSSDFSHSILSNHINGKTDYAKTFNELLMRCTPFNLRYYQGLTVLAFNGCSTDEIVDTVLHAAFTQPDACSALQGLLEYLSSHDKTAIFVRTVMSFFSVGLDKEHLALINVYVTLVTALGNSLDSSANWDLSAVPSFLDILVEKATEVSLKPPAIGCNDQWDEVVTLRTALSLVLRICVIGRLHGVKLPSEALPYLEKLLHIQVFADNYRVRTFIKDSLRLLLRISTSTYLKTTPTADTSAFLHAAIPGMSELYALSSREMPEGSTLSARLNATEGLLLFSKKRNSYTNLPVWAFDLIEDCSPSIKRNDGCVDLSYFECYED